MKDMEDFHLSGVQMRLVCALAAIVYSLCIQADLFSLMLMYLLCLASFFRSSNYPLVHASYVLSSRRTIW